MTWPAVNHYYEAVADRADADRYYAGVGLDEVAELVTRTHRERPRYRPAVELYPWVDLQPDRSLRSLYTGHRYDPAELIAADVRTADQRHAERARIAVVRSHVDDAAVQDMVERMLP